MTSLSCKVNKSVNCGNGLYVFKIHSRLSHLARSLLPQEGESPVHAQLYIYDPAEALDHHMHKPSDYDRAAGHVVLLDHQQCRIALRYNKECDQQRYNLPTAAFNEIAVILSGDGDEGSRDIVVYRCNGQGFQHISDLHPFYQALHYVLLFPTGQFE